MKRLVPWYALIFLVVAAAAPALGQAPPPDQVAELKTQLDKANEAITTLQGDSKLALDTIWVMVAAFLVFFMNLGFACVESGFCRAKNAVNILSKNFIVFGATAVGFWFIGWGLMFGHGSAWVGTEGVLMVQGPDNSPATATLASLIKSDIKDAYGIDLADDDVKAKYEKLDESIGEISDKARATVTAAKKTAKNSEGKEEEADATFAVKLDVPDKGTFEKEYAASSFYWGAYDSIAWSGVPIWAKFFFQLVFAATAATIVSGAVAERIKYHSFILFSFVMAIAIYPVVGHWIWGGGVLQAMGFLDFAGSTQVHSIGGWAALAGVIILGPRIGKYSADGKINAIPGHNLTAATIGCFILWFGWFGFNPGSTMAADARVISEVAITTALAASMATLTATATAWILLGKPDLGMTLNGSLAGLVAITAPCAFVTPGASLVIGGIAGVLVVLSVIMFDKIRVDDPVGATSVHLVNGVFGTLCVGLFASDLAAGNAGNINGLFYGGGAAQLIIQLKGVLYCGVYVFAVALVAWIVLKLTVGVRVSAEEEIEGLDIGEHGNEAYYGFAMNRELLTGGADPKAAMTPTSGKRFAIVVDTVSNGELVHAWSEMCQPGKAPDPKLFKEVYSNMTTVQGNRFVFRGGDPERMKEGLQTLLQGKLKGKLNVHVM
jgi:ammonium transporter, Amt family